MTRLILVFISDIFILIILLVKLIGYGLELLNNLTWKLITKLNHWSWHLRLFISNLSN